MTSTSSTNLDPTFGQRGRLDSDIKFQSPTFADARFSKRRTVIRLSEHTPLSEGGVEVSMVLVSDLSSLTKSFAAYHVTFYKLHVKACDRA